MHKHKIKFTDHYDLVLNALTSHGLLLGSYDPNGKANIMTIGWATIGSIWGIPIVTVLVRPSRYTYTCIEHTGCFSVNVPGADMGMACAICGSKSGKDMDKFSETGLTLEKGQNVLAPEVVECPIIYECQVVHSSDILPEKLDGQIIEGMYPDGDYHRIYFGKILSARAASDAAERLA